MDFFKPMQLKLFKLVLVRTHFVDMVDANLHDMAQICIEVVHCFVEFVGKIMIEHCFVKFLMTLKVVLLNLK
jgi:hypothetical protein